MGINGDEYIFEIPDNIATPKKKERLELCGFYMLGSLDTKPLENLMRPFEGKRIKITITEIE